MTRTPSALATVETAFGFLTCEPAPLALDARPIPGLPDRMLPLDELRRLLVTTKHDSTTTDPLWRQLVHHARNWGPNWVVAAAGVALPGLTRMAAQISRGHPRFAEDVDSEILAGFIQALREAPPEPPRLWLRLCWAAWRAGTTAIQADEGDQLPADLPSGSRTPSLPYGHPDLLLGRAAAAGIISREQADLIGATRFENALTEQLAAERGTTGQILRMRRRRAERALAAAVLRGDLSGPVSSARQHRREQGSLSR